MGHRGIKYLFKTFNGILWVEKKIKKNTPYLIKHLDALMRREEKS